MYNTDEGSGWGLPNSFEGDAFLSYERNPPPTKYLSSAVDLKNRDEYW